MLEHLILSNAVVATPADWQDYSSDIPVTGNIAHPANSGVADRIVLGPPLPMEPCYFDVDIASGYEQYTSSVSFVGISSGITSGNWDKDYNNVNTATWYWSGGVYGAWGNLNTLSPMYGGTYRFAINRESKLVYCKRISSPHGISSASILPLPPNFSMDIRPTVFGQLGYYRPQATFLGISLGSGGLY